MAYQPRTSIDPTATSGTELANIVEEVGDLVQLVVISATSGEPGSPADGDTYIHNGDSSWSSGSPDDVMVWLDNAWHVFSPTEGWLAYVQDVNELRGYDGSTWDEAHVVQWLNTDSRYVKNDPEHATDSGTDTYVSATNTTVPADGVKITRDFQSANTTTTPTLDAKTLTTRDGSALWPGAVSGVHDLQRDETADTYLVLEPLPIDEDDMASDSDAAVPTQQSVKAYSDSFEQQRAQAWVNFDGTGTVSISDNYNVSSITDNGTGDYTVNFSSTLADNNFSVVGMSGTTLRYSLTILSQAAGSVSVRNYSAQSDSREDANIVSVSVFGGN